MGDAGLTIMLVEDNPGDVRLTREALRDLAPRNLLVAQDGTEALHMLRAGVAEGELPDLILLDLNLPGKHGHEVLDEVKQDRDLRTIPVIIVTTSSSPEDVRRSYELHANCYITKPSDLERFFEVMRGIDHFWLNLVVLSEPVSRTA
jgi:two-component system, chemotaxis family, response regulator Rcp1